MTETLDAVVVLSIVLWIAALIDPRFMRWLARKMLAHAAGVDAYHEARQAWPERARNTGADLTRISRL